MKHLKFIMSFNKNLVVRLIIITNFRTEDTPGNTILALLYDVAVDPNHRLL